MKKIVQIAITIVSIAALTLPVYALEPVNAGFGTIKLDGLLQGRYTVDFDDNQHDQFKIRRTEIKFSGKINDQTTWAMMVDPARGIGDGEGADTSSDDSADKQKKRILQDLKLNLKQIPNTTITVGQYKIPFSMQGLTSSSKLPLIERSMINSKGKFGDTREIGLQVASGVKAATLTVGVFNGEGQNTSDMNETKDIGVRFTSDPVEGLHLGASYYNGRTGITQKYRVRTGVEFGYTHEKCFILSEYAIGKSGSSTSGLYLAKSKGWYVTVGMNIMDELQLIIRGDSWDPNIDKSKDRLDEVTFGINYFLLEHRAKVQVNYTGKMEEEGDESWNDTVVAQLQYSF